MTNSMTVITTLKIKYMYVVQPFILDRYAINYICVDWCELFKVSTSQSHYYRSSDTCFYVETAIFMVKSTSC